MKNNKKILIIYFIFFIFIMFLSPISGDDWGNYLVGKQGIHHMVGEAIGMYFSWEGRFASRLFINLLTYNKIIWNIVNSAVIISIIYFINNIYNFKNKKFSYLLSFLIITFMNLSTFSQVIVWIAGNITYLFVIPLLLFYIKLLYCKNTFSNKERILIIFLNIIIPMFVEHMAIILIFLNFIFLIIDFIKNKKINKSIVIFLLISISSFLLMFLSPGNRIRSEMENIEFNKLNIFGKINYNIPNFILYTYLVNSFLIFLIFIGSYLLIKNNVKNTIVKFILYIYEAISIMFGIFYILNYINILNIGLFNENSIITIIYYILLTILNFILLIKNSKDIKNDLAILFYTIGMLSNLVMLMSPTWGYRTSFSSYLFISISFMIIIDQYIKENKLINYSLSAANIVGMLFYIVFYINIHTVYNKNLVRIEKGIKNKSDNIELIIYPGFAPCNINPANEYHLKRFKEYYNINDSTNISFTENNWKFIIYK